MKLKISAYAMILASCCLSNSIICMNRDDFKQNNEANKKQKIEMEMENFNDLQKFFKEMKKSYSNEEIAKFFRDEIQEVCRKIVKNDEYGQTAIILSLNDIELCKFLIQYNLDDVNAQ